MAAFTGPVYDTFTFTHRVLDGRVVRLGFVLSERGGARVDLEETYALPSSLGPLSAPDRPAASRALLALHLAAGTSYWKTCIPREIVVEGAALSEEDARFWGDVYTLGLGEFFYRNGIDPTGRASFRASGPAATRGEDRREAGPPLLLWGGGKDSVVSHEALAASGAEHELLSVGREDWIWIRRSAEIARTPLHLVARRLDPKLAAMNAAGALNGHVPVSAVLAAAGSLTAALSARGAVLASNEGSASHGNTSWHGIDVNHQWSKSLDFERLYRRWLRDNLGPEADYVSLLRPLTELRIVKAFATHPEYFGAVTSCNANFRQSGETVPRFCLACPKCVFVSLMARPWMDDRTLLALFGGDALGSPSNLGTVEELLGVRGIKPFECVGTPEETAAAIYWSQRRGRAVPRHVIEAFAKSAPAQRPDLEAEATRALERGAIHELSPKRLAQLDGYLARH